MNILYIIGGIIALLAAYLLLTGGLDVGENVQFIVVGFFAGIITMFLVKGLIPGVI